MTNSQLGIGHWALVIDWSLGFGHWSFPQIGMIAED